MRSRTVTLSTCVENTFGTLSEIRRYKDHLHMCGEYHTYKISKVDNRGSPPHVWRILFNRCNHTIINRITSTCVENTRADEYLLQQYWDHLHMCGEYKLFKFFKTTFPGSPPHVWRIQIQAK